MLLFSMASHLGLLVICFLMGLIFHSTLQAFLQTYIQHLIIVVNMYNQRWDFLHFFQGFQFLGVIDSYYFEETPCPNLLDQALHPLLTFSFIMHFGSVLIFVQNKMHFKESRLRFLPAMDCIIGQDLPFNSFCILILKRICFHYTANLQFLVSFSLIFYQIISKQVDMAMIHTNLKSYLENVAVPNIPFLDSRHPCLCSLLIDFSFWRRFFSFEEQRLSSSQSRALYF